LPEIATNMPPLELLIVFEMFYRNMADVEHIWLFLFSKWHLWGLWVSGPPYTFLVRG